MEYQHRSSTAPCAHLAALLVTELKGLAALLGHGQGSTGHIVKVVVHDALPDQVLDGRGDLLCGLRRRPHSPLKVQVHLKGAVKRPSACKTCSYDEHGSHLSPKYTQGMLSERSPTCAPRALLSGLAPARHPGCSGRLSARFTSGLLQEVPPTCAAQHRRQAGACPPSIAIQELTLFGKLPSWKKKRFCLI